MSNQYESDKLSNQPLVTVIVPVYNVANYLDRCVHSLTNQTYDNLEIILVDDGSPDDCPAMCDKWANRDSRISVIHQTNAGLSAARNAGIKQMSGKYVAFVDSDDYVTNDYIELMLNEAQRTNADLVVCSFMQESDDGDGLQVENHIIEQRSGNTKDMYEIVSNGFIMAWNKLYRASLWNDISFPVGKVHEDELVFHKIFFKCKIVATTSKPLYHYGYNAQSIMHQKYSLKALAREEAWIDRIDYQIRFDCTKSISNNLGSIFADLDFAATQLDLSDSEVKNNIKALAKQLADTGVCKTSGIINRQQQLLAYAFTTMPMTYIKVKKLLNSIFHIHVQRV
ncbi:glycosyltransferase family 2 protein [Bifidobacterium callimiconis]|uniref:glycosyltransferase family 2 protein n=1 Tax=Bifidobacterium callimiconis TaxID=2306973 RepID=UPI001BDD9DC9|nr:glycosyltransferase family 2 protein [Bifidobacterium callimiconis]